MACGVRIISHISATPQKRIKVYKYGTGTTQYTWLTYTRSATSQATIPVKRGNSGLEEGFVLIGVKAEEMRRL